LGSTRGWLRYKLPHRYVRHHQHPTCIGQKQVWFLLRLVASEESLCLNACEKPEFDIWRWVDFWYPAAHVVNFKRQVYERALRQFAPVVETLLSIQIGNQPQQAEGEELPCSGPKGGQAAA
jgi:putative (di)nucleoside polyphosphate hydrolase